MKRSLPGWAVDNRASVLREVEDYRALMPSERLEVLKQVCETAAAFAEGHPDCERVLDFRDPLPRSSVEALARLRREAKRRADGR